MHARLIFGLMHLGNLGENCEAGLDPGKTSQKQISPARTGQKT
jgi:hypothetical protein